MDQQQKPRCPVCRMNRYVKQIGPRLFHCSGCDGNFDDDPNEGGTYDDHNPGRRMDRAEGHLNRRHKLAGQS